MRSKISKLGKLLVEEGYYLISFIIVFLQLPLFCGNTDFAVIYTVFGFKLVSLK